MTREEAINHLFDITMNPDYNIPIWEKEAIEMAMEALEQESALDKIRAEIETLNSVDYVSMSSYEGHKGASDMKDDVLQIIDKYKAESE